MSTTTPFNLTIVLPPNKQYYVSYFYPYEYSGDSRGTCKYRSNVTTALEEGWHIADIYNEFWKDNPTRGEPITGNTYKVPFIFDYSVQFKEKACTYFIFSYYENEELHSFVYAINANGAHTGGTYASDNIRPYLKTDTDGSLLVYVGFITDYGTQVYAPGRKIGNYTLGINDVLLRSATVDKCAYIGNNSQAGKYNNFPNEILVNGYYIFTSTDGVIDGEYQLVDGYNAGTKVPEFTNAILKSGFTLNWIPTSIHYHEDPNDTLNCAYIFRFKFTETNGENRIYRLIHFHTTGNVDGSLSSSGDLWIDPETKELKIWSWMINPSIRVLKQLPADTLSTWHELVIPYETYGNLKGFYFDGEYFDLVEICGRTLPASFRSSTIPGFSDISSALSHVAQDASKIVDYVAVHVYSETKPYAMKDNYFDYYEPILPEPEPEPEPIEPEEPTGIIIKGHVYLVCYKGDTSIYDNLIRIIKTNIVSKLPSPKPDFYKGVFIPPLHEPPHLKNLLPRGYPVHDYHPIPDINSDYTHVGLLVAHKNMLIPEEITYYACREDNGVFLYSEPTKYVDLFDLKHLTVPVKQIDSFYNKTKNIEGSVVGDMGYRIMMRPNSMSSIEWVARALNLGFPKRYTINKLIKFSKIEE
jgi:hypothetical protein